MGGRKRENAKKKRRGVPDGKEDDYSKRPGLRLNIHMNEVNVSCAGGQTVASRKEAKEGPEPDAPQ